MKDAGPDHLRPVTVELDDDAIKRLRRDAPPIPDAQDEIEMIFVPLDDLFVDSAYQRRISERGSSKIRRMIREFSWARFGAITIAETERGLAIIDGQHRAIAARAVGVSAVPAVKYRAAMAEQAMDFVEINTTRTRVASVDKFRAAVTAGDPSATEVAEILSELGISTDVAAGYSLNPRETRAVTVLQRMVKHTGKGILFTALEMLLDAQPDQGNLLTAFTIEAATKCVGRVIDAGGDIDRLLEIFETTDFDSLREDAAKMVKMTGGKTAERGAELLMHAYNKGLRRKVG